MIRYELDHRRKMAGVSIAAPVRRDVPIAAVEIPPTGFGSKASKGARHPKASDWNRLSSLFDITNSDETERTFVMTSNDRLRCPLNKSRASIFTCTIDEPDVHYHTWKRLYSTTKAMDLPLPTDDL